MKLIGIDTSPVNDDPSLGDLEGDGVGAVGAGEKVGAVGAFVAGESVASEVIGALVSSVPSLLGALVSSTASELGAFVPPPVDESTKVGGSVSSPLGASIMVGEGEPMTGAKVPSPPPVVGDVVGNDEGVTVGNVVTGSRVGVSVTVSPAGEEVSSTASFIVGLAVRRFVGLGVTGRSDGL